MWTHALGFAARAGNRSDWFSEHSTLIVGVVGIVVSGLVGPSVTGWWTKRRERSKDVRALIVARREDLRAVLDETATILGGAVTRLRPLLAAQLANQPLPAEQVEFLGSLTPLGQRLRLRLPDTHAVVAAFDACAARLRDLDGVETQTEWDSAVSQFETARKTYLEEGRRVLQAPVDEDKEI